MSKADEELCEARTRSHGSFRHQLTALKAAPLVYQPSQPSAASSLSQFLRWSMSLSWDYVELYPLLSGRSFHFSSTGPIPISSFSGHLSGLNPRPSALVFPNALNSPCPGWPGHLFSYLFVIASLFESIVLFLV